jgi:hypothetical protein
VDEALSDALREAARAQEWELAREIIAELRARREGGAS